MLNVYAIGDWVSHPHWCWGWGELPNNRQQHNRSGHNSITRQITGSGWCWHISLSHSFLTLAFLSRVRWQPRPGALMIFPKGEPKNLRHLTLDSIKLVCLRTQFWEKLQLLIIHLKLNKRGLETSNPTTLNVNGITILSNEHKAISSCNKRVSLLFGRTLKGVSWMSIVAWLSPWLLKKLETWEDVKLGLVVSCTVMQSADSRSEELSLAPPALCCYSLS